MKESKVFQAQWPEGLEANQGYVFPCDDKGRNGQTWLRIVISEDGDAWLCMQEWERFPEGHPDYMPTVRCRTGIGGGRHDRTHQALLWLAQAIRLDNEDLEKRYSKFKEKS